MPNDFFKKYSTPSILSDKTYADALDAFRHEWTSNTLFDISRMTNNLNIETADPQFLYELFDFYGIQLSKITNTNKINTNILRRYKTLLKNRGQIKTLYSVLESGGSLFEFNRYPITIFNMHDVPQWLEGKPQDGFIYVLCKSTDVVSKNNFIESVRPMGYTFQILLLDEVEMVHPYYGDLRMDMGWEGSLLNPNGTPVLVDTSSNQFMFYKNIEDGEGRYLPSSFFYGNFGSRDWNNIDIINSLTEDGFIDSYTALSNQSYYPSPFVDSNGGVNSASAATLFNMFGNAVQFKKDPKTDQFIGAGQFSNRRVHGEQSTVDWFYSGHKSNLAPDVSLIESPLVLDLNQLIKTGSKITTGGDFSSWILNTEDNKTFWRSNNNHDNTEPLSKMRLSIPNNFISLGNPSTSSTSSTSVKDGLFDFMVRFTNNTSSSVYLSICEVDQNGNVIQELKRIVYTDLEENQWKHAQIKIPLKTPGLFDPHEIEFRWNNDLESNIYPVICDIDFSQTAWKEHIQYEVWNGASRSDALDFTHSVWVENWAFETMYQNNLTIEDLYFQYKEEEDTTNAIATTPANDWHSNMSFYTKAWEISTRSVNAKQRTIVSYDTTGKTGVLFKPSISFKTSNHSPAIPVRLYYTKQSSGRTDLGFAISVLAKPAEGVVAGIPSFNDRPDTDEMTEWVLPLNGELCFYASISPKFRTTKVEIDITNLVPFIDIEHFETENKMFWPPCIGFQDRIE